MIERKTAAVRAIVNTMVNGGFMHGWFGDVDKEFRDEKVLEFLDMTPVEQKAWVAGNRFNLTRYCRVPAYVLQLAVEPWRRV